MNILILSFFFIFGAIIGSFLNVVLFRYNTGRSVGGRSKCFSCKRTLSPFDLIPIVSYLFSFGRCRTCKSHISFQYPIVEMITGVLFAGVYALYAPLLLLNPTLFFVKVGFSLIVMSLLVLITVYDFRHKIIPDVFAYTFASVSFVALFIQVGVNQLYIAIPPITEMFAGIILAFPFYFLWSVSRGRWMGLGDAKLALGIGWFLGLIQGATAIMYGFWIGAAVSICILTVQKLSRRKTGLLIGAETNLSMKSEIPFAPFLIVGLLIVYFFGYTIFSFLEIL